MKIITELKRSILVFVVLFVLVNFAFFVLAKQVPVIPNSGDWINNFIFPTVEIVEDARDMDPAGSGRLAPEKKVARLADTWNRQNRGFRISGTYNVNPLTNSDFVLWTISFEYDIPLDRFNSGATERKVRKINDAIIGEVIVSTFNEIEPATIAVNEINWVTVDAENIDKNPQFWIVGYQVRRHCLEKIAQSRDYSVWNTCAIPKEGKIFLINEDTS